MSSNYQLSVLETISEHQSSEYHVQAKRLDQCMLSPCTQHIVLGRQGCEALLLAYYQRTLVDYNAALVEACGYYACQTGFWPDFLSSRCQISRVLVQGVARPDCLEFARRRLLLTLSWADLAFHEEMSRPRLFEARKSRKVVARAVEQMQVA